MAVTYMPAMTFAETVPQESAAQQVERTDDALTSSDSKVEDDGDAIGEIAADKESEAEKQTRKNSEDGDSQVSAKESKADEQTSGEDSSQTKETQAAKKTPAKAAAPRKAAGDSQYSNDLADFLQDITIEGLEPDEDGTYYLYPDTEYEITLSFSEEQGETQFANSGDLRLNLKEAFERGLELEVFDKSGTFVITVTSVTKEELSLNCEYYFDGDELVVRWDETPSDAYTAFKDSPNAQFSLSFIGQYSGENEQILIGSETLSLAPNTDTSVSISKTASNVDLVSGEVDYVIEVGSTGFNTNVVVEDLLDLEAGETALTIDTDSIQVHRDNQWGQLLSEYSEYNKEECDEGHFKINLGSMKHGDVIVITYKAYLDSNVLADSDYWENNDGISKLKDESPITHNIAVVTSDDGNTDSADEYLVDEITPPEIKKSGGKQDALDKSLVPWTIEFQSIPTTLGSLTGEIHDELSNSENNSDLMQYAGEGIDIIVADKDSDGNVVKTEGTISWTELGISEA
ncbi:MAG: type III secretion system chaperone, partial [Firmicutes bacterium]|nr:type III secretion system chaperone [Bacillota bacterium]